jgi:hypothetical protein
MSKHHPTTRNLFRLPASFGDGQCEATLIDKDQIVVGDPLWRHSWNYSATSASADTALPRATRL